MAKKPNNRPAGGKSGAMSGTTRLFLAGACAEVYLLTVYRFYVKGSHSMLLAWYDTYLPAIMWVGLGVLLLGLVLLGMGKSKEKLLPLGKLTVCAGVFLAVTAPAIRIWTATALTPLCVIVPAVMLLAFLWRVYDRECVYGLAALCTALLVIWMCRRGLGNSVWAMPTRVIAAAFRAVCAAAAALLRKAEAGNGQLKGLRILPPKANYSVAYGALLVSAALVAAGMINVTVAYFAMWAAAICIFAVAVYCTVQQL